ncbi:MAG: histone deacetylase [Myxococcales bacterium]|nr:histone deacetylase [Myxococcales bacterium]
MLFGAENRVRRWLFGRDLAVWYSPDYRLPLTSLEARTGFAPRRADNAVWFLLERRAIARQNLRTPRRAGYDELSRVHTPELLESLGRAETLARIWNTDAGDVPVDEVMNTVRLACGGTVDAAREVLSPANPRRFGTRALNLLGGFHHARPDVAGGFCPVNDVAIAIAAVRADGFSGRVVVLDLDAHPPDGTAACLQHDRSCFLGSISVADWGPLPGVDETVLAQGAGDAAYLAALDALLARIPKGDLAFVIASGDVLGGDPLGDLGLTLEGCRERDLRVADALLRVPSVWLPGGGYTDDAWRALAGTGLALGIRSRAPIPRRYDPLVARFTAIAQSLAPSDLGRTAEMEIDDVAADLGFSTGERKLWMSFYTAEGIEHALHRYGVLGEIRRLGYGPFRVEIHDESVGQSARLVNAPTGEVLIEVVVERHGDMLYVHWLALRHPRARFSAERPRLPGQDVPGLGLAREMSLLLMRMAVRLGLQGLALRPAAYHFAYAGRDRLHFLDPARQGRFEALVEALRGLPLVDATRAVMEGRVLLNGAPYTWEADEMVKWVEPRAEDRAAIEAEKARCHFELKQA